MIKQTRYIWFPFFFLLFVLYTKDEQIPDNRSTSTEITTPNDLGIYAK